MNMVKLYRTQLKMTRRELSAQTGLSMSYVYFIENGERNPTITVACKIAHVLQQSLDVLFLPTPEAKKAHKELAEMITHFPMGVDDFQDWYSFVIDTTCKTCTRADYEECAARRVLTKYDVFPADPEAKDKCQYSYADGAPEAAVVVTEQVQSEVEAAACIEQPQLEPEPVCKPEPIMPEHDEPATVPDKPDGLLPVSLILASGYKAQLDLPDYMAKNLFNELNRPGRTSRALCACHVGEELIAVDMAEVVMMTVVGLEDGTWCRPKQPALQPVQTQQPVQYEDDGQRERYRVECECGQEYFCSMNTGRDRARCRECKATLFADRQAERVKDPVDGDFATLLTNRYWVHQAERRESPKFSGKAKYGYADPCNPFA